MRNGSPSPANIRAGSSLSRLKGKTPEVKGNEPGRFSERSQRSNSPSSVNPGNATRGILLPDNEVRTRGIDPLEVTSSSPENSRRREANASSSERLDGSTLCSSAFESPANSARTSATPWSSAICRVARTCPAWRTALTWALVVAWYSRIAWAISERYRERVAGIIGGELSETMVVTGASCGSLMARP